MPGSYPDPRYYANSAIQILEEAYEDSQGSHTGSLILKAIETIARLKEEIIAQRKLDSIEFDQYDLDESNSAI
jgi:hypothetical protein